MASSSHRIRKYHVFPSFHGPDVRRNFLSHLHYHFASKGITVFKDQEIVRGQTIGPELKQAIRESRISMVVLSKNYASSSWCLDELVEILECKEACGQMVMTIFYDVDPSDVRQQSGDFGRAFGRTCEIQTEEVKQIWSKALTDVAEIAGVHSLSWDDEAKMMQKIVADVSKNLNVTLSRDCDKVVGLRSHLRKVYPLLCLECDEVKMIGIWGPAGIGKTTIARALYNQLSSSFPLRCFMGNLKGSYNKSIMGVDDYDSKLCLQSQLLSTIFNQTDMKVHDLCAIKEWLHDQRVLIILDDVEELEQLDTLAKETSWFGPGSRIIFTMKDKNILKAHGIKEIYHVDLPSEEEALEILCLSAFKQRSPREGFKELSHRIAELCGYLPLGLCVVGSSLRGASKNEWGHQLYRLETSLDRKIGNVLRVGYETLLQKDQVLFLHIACFFYNENVDHMTTLLSKGNLDVRNGLKTLADKSLVKVSIDGRIVMHCLLQKLGRQIVLEQSVEPGRRQFLVEPQEICDVLANETGTGSVLDISRNIKHLNVRNTKIREVPPTIGRHWSSLTWLHIGSRNLMTLSYVPESLRKLDLRNSHFITIPDCVISLPFVQSLIIQNCRTLVSLQGLPPSLWCLDATDCRSLTTVLHTFGDPCASFNYRNCVMLEEEARRRIIQKWDYNYLCLPGKEVPINFTHKATGNSIAVPMSLHVEGTISASSRFKACLLLSPVKGYPLFDITCRLRSKEGILLNEVEYWISGLSPKFLTEHLLIFCGDLFQTDKCHELDITTSEILFEFSCRDNDDKIIECGVQILREEGESSSSAMDCYETRGNNNHHTDGEYKAENTL
uniref:ADP-ribosyl cyclase/cyclic ADP-ribose hydrolase n=1 Tax=Brassica oleracea var. oleracea TaxID=109376 RepID=A0A0D3CTA3_BRAOL